MRFARFEFLYILLAVCALVVLLQWRWKRRYLFHSLVHDPVMLQLMPSQLRNLPRLLLLVGVTLAGISLMDPRITFREKTTRLAGVDIALVVDLSTSMLEFAGGWEVTRQYLEVRQGVGPKPDTRMQVVQRALMDFMSKRKGDRLGLIAFSENTYVVSALTTDHTYLKKYIPLMDPDMLLGEGKTAIGNGVGSAIDLFQRESDPATKNKVIVVFTDGTNNCGRDPIEAVGEARSRGYRVYLIGVEIGPELTRKEEVKRLVQAVRSTGGQYFDAADKTKLEEAYTTIDRIEKGSFVEHTLATDVPIYQVFVYASLACLLVGLALTAIPYFAEIS